jgi:hypothetical protein
MIISFPGGAGGNWLQTVIDNEPITHRNKINFHRHSINSDVRLIHSLNPTEFDCLYSGSYYFNFYVNVMYKHFYAETDLFTHNNYKEYYTKCVGTARYICLFDTIKDLIRLDFDRLISDPESFYQSLQQQVPGWTMDFSDFSNRKTDFFSTFVETENLYENFDSQFWVTFVLGQLMNHDIYPQDFNIYDPSTQHLSSQFAQDNYKFCQLKNNHNFKTGIILPILLEKD